MRFYPFVVVGIAGRGDWGLGIGRLIVCVGDRMATNRMITIAIITVLVLLIMAVIVSKFR